MKNLYITLALAALAATTLVACNKEPQPVDEPGTKTGKTTITFTAQATDPSTKATLTPNSGDSAFEAAWDANDKLKLIASNGSNSEETIATWNATDNVFSAPFNTLSGTNNWTYKAIWPVPGNDGIEFGSNRTQNGNNYNSKFDVMYGSKSVSAPIGKESDGETPLFIPMDRLTGIAYFHITGGPANEKVVSAKLQATGIAAESVSVSDAGALVIPNERLDEINLTISGDVSASDFALWFNVLPGNYSGLTLTITTNGGKTATLQNNKNITYAAGKLNKAQLSGLTWKLANAVFFEERFSEASGTAGFSGGAASSDFVSDNEGWVADGDKKYAGDGCAKFGTSTVVGNVTTPGIIISNDYWNEPLTLSFRAGAWVGDGTNLTISADGATVSPSQVTLKNGEWTDYSVSLSDVTKSSITITFKPEKRWLLDDVLLYYGVKPVVEDLIVSPEGDKEVNYKAGSIEYTVAYSIDGTSSSNWDVTTSSEGFSVAKNGNGFTVSFTTNEGLSARTGSIIVTAGNKSKTINIIQNAVRWDDTLTASLIGVTGAYTDWTNLIVMTDAVYAGNSTTKQGGTAIQMRNSGNSGIVSTVSGGIIRKVVVTWADGNYAAGRTLDIYGKSSAYESTADLYDSSAAGTKVGSLNSASNTTEYTFTGDYRYVGVKANDGALYIEDITFIWEEYDPNKPVFGASIVGESEIAADVTTGSIQVTGNVFWTASASNGASVSPTSGNGETTLSVTLPENTDYNNSASYVVTVSTTANVTTKSYNLTYTQSPAVNPAVPKVYTIQWGADYNETSVSSYEATWNANNNGFKVNMANFNNNNNGWEYVKCGRKNNASVATIITDAAIPEAIKTVTITIDALTAEKINSIKLSVSSSKTSGWESAGTFTKATGNQTVTITSPAANKYYKIEFNCASGSSNGLLTLSKAVFSTN